MQFLIQNKRVECPVCDSPLSLKSEQDRRVATMKHDGVPLCTFNGKTFRIDRMTGYGEVSNEA